MFWNALKAVVNPSKYEVVEKLEHRKLRDMACKDALTNLNRRWVFFEELEKELFRLNRIGHGIAVFVMDLDDLREHNKKGHANGDRALKAVSYVIRRNIRRCDLSARLSEGGDEFIVAVPFTDASHIVTLAKRLCDKCKQENASVTIGVSYREEIKAGSNCKQLTQDLYAEASEVLIEGKASCKSSVYVKYVSEKATYCLTLRGFELCQNISVS